MAVGKSGAQLDPDALEIAFAGIEVCRGGTGARASTRRPPPRRSPSAEVDVDVDLHLGDGAATVWTCDLTYEYVRINGEYRS